LATLKGQLKGSNESEEFRERLEKYRSVRDQVDKIWRLTEEGLQNAFNASVHGGPSVEIAAMLDGLVIMSEAVYMPKVDAIMSLSSADLYELPFVEGEHLVPTMQALLQEFGLPADPALQAYIEFEGHIQAIQDHSADLQGLGELYEAISDPEDLGPLQEFIQAREKARKSWSAAEGVLTSAEVSLEQFSLAADALGIAFWKKQVEHGRNTIHAIKQKLQQENRPVYLEFVEQDLAKLIFDALRAQKEHRPIKGEREAFIDKASAAEGRYRALLVELARMKDLKEAALAGEVSAGNLQERIMVFLGEKRWFLGQLDILDGLLAECKDAGNVYRMAAEPVGGLCEVLADEDRVRYTTLRDQIAELREEADAALLVDAEALSRTAAVKADPALSAALLEKTKAHEASMAVSLESSTYDEEDPIHVLYTQLRCEEAQLMDWELFRSKAESPSRAFHRALDLEIDSLNAFLRAENAFNDTREGQRHARQAIEDVLGQLREALEESSGSRKEHWTRVLEAEEEGLSLGKHYEIVGEMLARRSPVHIAKLRALDDQRGGQRKAYRALMNVARKDMRAAADRLEETKALRNAMLASPTADDLLRVARLFANAGDDLFEAAGIARTAIYNLDNSEELPAYKAPEKDALEAEAFQLDQEDRDELDGQLQALEAVEAVVDVSDAEIDAIPAIRSKQDGSLRRTLLDIIRPGSHYD
jgi:hypothetical protein